MHDPGKVGYLSGVLFFPLIIEKYKLKSGTKSELIDSMSICFKAPIQVVAFFMPIMMVRYSGVIIRLH